MFKLCGPAVLVTLIGFGIAWYFVEPAPPDTVVIATGSQDGLYYAFGEAYSEVFQENGVTLDVRSTAGSIENYSLLEEENGIDLAIVQGGTADERTRDASGLETIASLYLEPVWVFYRDADELDELRQLGGKRIAVGAVGSGTRAIALELLQANGVVGEAADSPRTALLDEGGIAAADKLRDGTIDAAFFVISPRSEIVRNLLHDDDVRLMSFERQDAYRRLYPYLSSVTLPPGVVDLANNLPSQPVKLIAPTANLVATPELHDAFVPLLLKAAAASHESGDLLAEKGQFPSLKYIEFPPNEAAEQYFKSGPSFLQRYLPFWVASLLDRTKIMLLPLLTLLIPLLKVAPPVYRWRIRSRIYKWYGVLRNIDQQMRQGESAEMLREHVTTLRTMERELNEVTVPLSYMEEFYNLRLHIDLVQRRLLERVSEQKASDRKIA